MVFFNPKIVISGIYLEPTYTHTHRKCNCMGGSPGLVVLGGDSCTEDHGFESQHLRLDRHDICNIYLLLKLYCLI